MIFFLIFFTPDIFHLARSEQYDLNDLNSHYAPREAVHFTIVYHTTALIQIFNMISGRNYGYREYVLDAGLTKNKLFWYLVLACYVIQQLTVYFGGIYFKCSPIRLVHQIFCHFWAFGSMVLYWVMKALLRGDFAK